MPSALITGITGQDGSYLADLLLSKGYQVIGLVRRTSTVRFSRIQHIQDSVTILQGDLYDQSSLLDIMERFQPDEVYNLAAQSFVPVSWNQPVLTGEVTALGVARLLEAVRLAKPDTRFYQASSSEMFGDPLEVPQKETTPFNPRNPYGVAKLFGHRLVANYRKRYNMFAVSGILYNHESPRRGLEFVTRKITYAVARIKLGKADELRLGNLDARRDWGFAGDYAEGMWRMLQHNQPTDFILGTGKTHSVREFCDAAFNFVGLDYQQYVIQDPRFYRPVEPRQLVADPSKARQVLEWKPQVTFTELVEMMVSADLNRVASEVT